MPYFKGQKSKESADVNIYYEDYGSGQPVILVHGWPLSGTMFEYQIPAIVDAGFRCITYDRRGFGKSDHTWDGHNYDTLSGDLHKLIDYLDLENVILLGFSMGGGELARFVGKYGTKKLAKLIFLSSIAPFMLKTDDNPDGVPEEAFEGFKKDMRSDRLGFLNEFGKGFVNYEDNKNRISEGQLHYNWNVAAGAMPKATIDCVDAFGKTDLRNDLKCIDIPTMFIHGDQDQTVPKEPTAEQGHKIVKDSILHIIKGAPHGCTFTHKDEVNKLILDFIK